MSDNKLNLRDLFALNTLLEAVTTGARVRWSTDGGETVLDGVARHFVKDRENFSFLSNGDDVRDAFVRISSTFEWTIPVREAMELVSDNMFFIAKS
jgi:hypothetical protein